MGDYTATDILECCGLEPAGAPRMVICCAEFVAAAQNGPIDVALGEHSSRATWPGNLKDWPQDMRLDRYLRHRFTPGASVGGGVEPVALAWMTLMARELEIPLDVRFVPSFPSGCGPRVSGVAQPMWKVRGTRTSSEIDTVEPNGSEATAQWYKRCVYPLGPRRAP